MFIIRLFLAKYLIKKSGVAVVGYRKGEFISPSSLVLFPENLNVFGDEVEENIEIPGKKNSLFPRDHVPDITC